MDYLEVNMKTIPLGLSRNYVSSWGIWEACRELIQNMLDCDIGTVDYEPSQNVLRVSSGPLILSPATLLLGGGDKAQASEKRGMYGEGYKLAFLVLLRAGKSVLLKTGNQVWRPHFAYHNQLERECLYVDIEEREGQWVEGVEIQVQDFTDNDYAEIVDKYTGFNGYEPIAEHNGGTIFIQEKPAIYVGGLFVRYLGGMGYDYKYSYDLPPNWVTLDRDRNAIGDYYVSLHATKILAGAEEWDMLAQLAVENADDIHDHTKVHSQTDDMLFTNKAIAKASEKAFFKKHGSNAHPVDAGLTSQEKAKAIVDATQAGYNPIEVKSSLYSMFSEKVREQRVTGGEIKSIGDMLEQFVNKFDSQLSNEQLTELSEIFIMQSIVNGNPKTEAPWN